MRDGGRWQRRAYGWRNEEAIRSRAHFGPRPDLDAQRTLRQIAETGRRNRRLSMQAGWAAALGLAPIILAVVVGLVVGETAGFITVAAAVVLLVLLASFVAVRSSD